MLIKIRWMRRTTKSNNMSKWCVLHHIAELRELKTTVADGQIKTKDDGAWQEDVQPRDSVKGAGDKAYDCVHRFCLRTIPRSSILS